MGRSLKQAVVAQLVDVAHRRRDLSLVLQVTPTREQRGARVVAANDGRDGRRWVPIGEGVLDASRLRGVLAALAEHAGKDIVVWPHGEVMRACRALALEEGTHALRLGGHTVRLGSIAALPVLEVAPAVTHAPAGFLGGSALSHLDRLESEAIHIMREVVAQAERPVMLYSIGKDSAVMLHIARKAFAPGTPPFPLMHVDTRWKFQDMYLLRDEMARRSGMELIVYQNPEGVERDINPITHGSALHTDIMKTEGLKKALDHYSFDAAFGGARRDEEKSRAKERVFSFRNAQHRWDPKSQRPELWRLYNARHNPGESIRVFPLSNWTELDIWLYIHREKIPIVPLYFARERPVVERDGTLLMVDDDRLPIGETETIQCRRVRFRTLGCYPLSGAVESDAVDLPGILLELIRARTSERQGRLIDTDSANSMEKKKVEGYF
ncbi:MAG: sulfate adenylyltransferase subunit CysD [Planctomycetota bacterium]|nr:sulfate adenylyltransferase subunit CysD [Planctomycetota bacterium]MDA1106131.1 sulfate adenylyltransferase subunit CysD [Planctomycetota bacterium]